MTYLVRKKEIDYDNRNAIAAGFLSILLGWLGVHRFYLGRPLSGLLILLTTLGSLGIAMLVWVPITIVEGVMLFTENTKKNSPKDSDRDDDINSSGSEESATVSSRSYSGQSQQNQVLENEEKNIWQEDDISVDFHEVSNLDTSQIFNLVEDEEQKAEQSKWLNMLEFPYERRTLQKVDKLRRAVHIFFDDLAEYIDSELRADKSSLENVIRKSQNTRFSYYDDVLQTIYSISEDLVVEHYTNGSTGYSEFSYDLLKRHIGQKVASNAMAFGNKLTKNLPLADDEIRQAFGLTPNGFRITWWDKDGRLRGDNKLTPREEMILNTTQPRSTKLYNTPEAREVIFSYYFLSLDRLKYHLENTDGWKVRIRQYLNQVLNNERSNYVNNPQQFKVLGHILKLCEQSFRESVPYIKPLDTKKEIASLKRSIPKEAADDLLKFIKDLESDAELTEDLKIKVLHDNSIAWKYELEGIEKLSMDRVVDILNRYQEDESYGSVCKDIFQRHTNEKAQLLALYQYHISSGKIDERSEKKLQNLIHEGHLNRYKEILELKKIPSLKLAEELINLTTPPRKEVVLDETKIKESNEELEGVVRSVNSYLSSNSDVEEREMSSNLEDYTEQSSSGQEVSLGALFDEPSEEAQLSHEQEQFIIMIIQHSNKLPLQDANEYAVSIKKPINGFLQSINKELYKKFGDQVIRKDSKNVIIDNEYLQEVKGLYK